MKIYKKTELPMPDTEDFSVTVLTYHENGVNNLGFYNFDSEDWSFFTDSDNEYKDSEFVWMYPPNRQMEAFFIKTIKDKDKDESAPPSSKESWYKKNTKHIKKKITLALKKK